MGDRQINLQFGHDAGASVDAYLEYRRCVSLKVRPNLSVQRSTSTEFQTMEPIPYLL